MFSSIQDEKLKQILYAAKDLFWKYGVKRVTVEEVCSEANVSKMTFYKHFKNKIELVNDILERFVGELLDEYNDLVNSDKSFQDKIQGMFIIKHKAADGISKEFINDIYKNPEMGLHIKMEEMGKRSMGIFAKFIEDSKKKNQIREDVNIQMILSYFNYVSLMMDDEQVVSHYEKIEDLIIEAMSFCFYGIMPRQS